MHTKINFNRYTHIIFDFDGTIADTFAVSLNAYNQYAQAKNKPTLDLTTAKELKSIPYKKIIQKLQLKFWQIPAMLKTVQNNVSEHMQEVVPFLGMLELTQQLHSNGKTIGIVTSNSAKNVEIFLSQYFTQPVIPDQKNYKKKTFDSLTSALSAQNPLPKSPFSFLYSGKNILGKHRTFKKMFREQQFTADQALYIGDEVRDIQACKKVGMDVAAVTWGWNEKKILEEAQPEYVVENVPNTLPLEQGKVSKGRKG